MLVDGSLESIRSRHESHAVSLELEGESGFLASLPGVEAVKPAGRRLEVELSDRADPQDLLRALVERVRVLAFEIKQPTLHEIFVKLVGGGDAEDS